MAFRVSRRLLLSASLFLAAVTGLHAADPTPLTLPAFTAYTEPAPEALDIGDMDPIRGWKDPHTTVAWYGQIRSTGPLHVALRLQLPVGERSTLRMRVNGRALPAKEIVGTSAPMTVSFGTITVADTKAFRFALTGLKKSGATFGDLDALLLTGAATQNALFNLTPQRGAPSVHLNYPIPQDAKVEWFYNEVTVKTDPIWSYYEACGFARGYFGIQVNSPTERRIIFSVWDSGAEAVDRSKVATDNRVTLLAKGPGVFASDFGNEGTGGHSHLVYPWKTGKTYRFLVHAVPSGETTVYTAYFYFPEKHNWGMIASFRAPKDGGYLRHLYSFNEDFNGANGQQKRLAEFGNQFIQTTDGKWTELLQARFTHTARGKYADRLDRAAGVDGDRFYLTAGGFKTSSMKYNDLVTRPADAKPPKIVLPTASAAAAGSQ